MSMHKIPLTPLEEEGLRLHGLPVGTPSQRSDTFRQGMAWAIKAAPNPPAELAISGDPVAWMHDKNGRVDTCHNSVKELWIKVGQKQNTQLMREIVPCRVEHYNIPLYLHPEPNPQQSLASWQPISTAPKDGKPVLMLRPSGVMIVVWWSAGGWKSGDGVGHLALTQRAKWMLLPEPAP